MFTRSEMLTRDDTPKEDHVVFLSEVSWEDYERFLAIRGDRSAPRFTYDQGVLEIMSPSRNHESLKSLIGCLVEAYCFDANIRFNPFGSWTLKHKADERGVEPDECYILGDEDADSPHLAIEVIWTSGRMNKLDIYRRFGVAEVWVWRQGKLGVHVLRAGTYVEVEQSEVLPGLDLDLLIEHLDRPTAYDAVRDFREALKSNTPST